jgi:hypothetical protein
MHVVHSVVRDLQQRGEHDVVEEVGVERAQALGSVAREERDGRRQRLGHERPPPGLGQSEGVGRGRA